MLERLSQVSLTRDEQSSHLGIVDGNVKLLTDSPELPDEVDQLGTALLMKKKKTSSLNK